MWQPAAVWTTTLGLVLVGCGSASPPASPPASSTASSTAGPTPSARVSAVSPVVGAGQIVALTTQNDIVVLAADGVRIRSLGHLGATVGDEVNSVDVSPDGGRVVLSVLNDHDLMCRATVYSIGVDGFRAPLVAGAAASFSPDGRMLAFIRYAAKGEFCLRSQLVIRRLEDGSETVAAVPGGAGVEGSPPSWPLNWSPDGRRITLVGGQGALVTTVGVWDVRLVGSGQSRGGTPPQAPVFVDGNVAAMTGCCVGADQQMASFPAGGGDSSRLFGLTGPVRSIRTDRGGKGLWLTTEDSTLWRWEGGRLRAVRRGVLIASG